MQWCDNHWCEIWETVAVSSKSISFPNQFSCRRLAKCKIVVLVVSDLSINSFQLSCLFCRSRTASVGIVFGQLATCYNLKQIKQASLKIVPCHIYCKQEWLCTFWTTHDVSWKLTSGFRNRMTFKRTSHEFFPLTTQHVIPPVKFW